jgi:hypothetical protein
MGCEIQKLSLIRATFRIADGALYQLTLFEPALPDGIVTGELPIAMQHAIDKLTLLNTTAPVYQLAMAIKKPFAKRPFIVTTIGPGEPAFTMEEIITGFTIVDSPVRQTHICRPLHWITASQRDKNHSKTAYFHRQTCSVFIGVIQPAV